MRKRIRLHQLRVGMFVEEIDQSGFEPQRITPFLVKSPDEIEEVMANKVMSVVIDTRKGADTSPLMIPLRSYTPEHFEAELLSRFSLEKIRQARQTIADTSPHIRELQHKARKGQSLGIDAMQAAVQRIMQDALGNAGALITLSQLKTRDEGTFLHSLGVSALMISFGRILGYDEDYVRLLGIGGLVHDIGKMILPLDILNKTGHLTAEEMTVVRTHPERGCELLLQMDNLPQEVLDITLCHHEKYDGSGYPHRLAGKQIPIAARIAAVCDVYEAMTSVRPYKRALSQAEAIDMMLHETGHFDPLLLRSFVSKMIFAGAI